MPAVCALDLQSSLSMAVSHAKYEGFEQIEISVGKNTGETKKIYRPEWTIDIYCIFPQSWSSTALGFGGIGGQSITKAHTIILETNSIDYVLVYFNGRFAYKANPHNYLFEKDVAKRQMLPVKDAALYL